MKRILYQFPTWLQRLVYKDALWRGDTTRRYVYLTFDDGPVTEVTPQVLDILDQYNVKATFFWVGENLIKYPHLAQEVVRRGHQVGNHTYNHISGWQTSHKRYIDNILKTDDIMRDTLGPQWQPSHLFRPPYGKAGQRMHKWLKDNGYKVVLWDVVTHDYNPHYSPKRIEQIVLRYVRNGSILLLHDSLKSKDNTLALLPSLIHRLQLEGYEFLTL
ncbi:MAG: polysaccharide deacetylase family protein [Paludibacteraceae bacterium]|nr:polysaccharide deacetylase family protein [Paludibacteraceae bacterium]